MESLKTPMPSMELAIFRIVKLILRLPQATLAHRLHNLQQEVEPMALTSTA